MGCSHINGKGMWNIDEFDLPLPNNHEEVATAADDLFAELLIKYFMSKKDVDKYWQERL